MAKHYTAIIEILKVLSTPPPVQRGISPAALKSDGQKEKREVLRVVLRADSIESLIKKATAHLELVEDISDGD
jgi:hypothetical protein